jgi:hypothetical protein
MPLVMPKTVASFAQDTKSPAEFSIKVFDRLKHTLPQIDVMYNAVLVAAYIRPELERGIIRDRSEDVWQGKSGLVLKLGKTAFVDDDVNQFYGEKVFVGDWVGFFIAEAKLLSINEVACRLIEDSNIRLRVKDPSIIF